MTPTKTGPRFGLRYLAGTALTLAALTSSTYAACVSLKGSAVCPSFADFSVDTSIVPTLVDYGIRMAAFSSVAEFDQAALNATGFQTTSTCTGYSGSIRIPYQNTVLCTIAVKDEKSLACKDGAPSMCDTSCTLYSEGLSAMIASTCPSDKASAADLSNLQKVCAKEIPDWAGLQDKSAGCMNALTNEALTCGLGTALAKCEFCKNSTAACCADAATTCNYPTTTTGSSSSTSINPPPATGTGSDLDKGPGSGLSKAALGGIIGGSVALVLIAVIICIVCMRRSKKHGGGKGKNSNLSRQISNSSGRYNISSPKVQEEGFSATGVSPPIQMKNFLPTIQPTEPMSQSVGMAAAGAGMATAAAGARESTVSAGGKQSYCQALYPYQASMADELDLTPGDIVNVQRVFDDGWAVGINMNTSNEGAFPVVCVMFVDESVLDDDFEDVNMHSMAPMTLREEDQEGRRSPSGRNSPRSSLPSRSSSPVHLPRRNSSIRESLVITPGSNPITSSPLAGDQRGRVTPVRDTVMSDASSINRWWDGEGK